MRQPLILTALIGAALLSACSPSSSNPTPPIASASSQTPALSDVDARLAAAGIQPTNVSSLSETQYQAIVQQGHGFQVGASMARDTGFVFFDPQCPHCGRLWQASQPLQASTNVRWMPVAFLNAMSLPQGVALLRAADGPAQMAKHEDSMQAHQGGLPVSGAPDPSLAAQVNDNLKLLEASGGHSVPFLVHKSADGKARAVKGELTTEQLRTFLNS